MHVIDALGRRKVSGGTSLWAYAGKNDHGASYRMQNANFQIYNTTQSGWQTPYLRGGPGVEFFVLGGVETDANSGTGYIETNPDGTNGTTIRIHNSNLQFWNVDQSIWQTPFVRNIMGAPQLVIGSGDKTTSFGAGCTIKTVSSDYTATTDDCVILADATLGNITKIRGLPS